MGISQDDPLYQNEMDMEMESNKQKSLPEEVSEKVNKKLTIS